MVIFTVSYGANERDIWPVPMDCGFVWSPDHIGPRFELVRQF